MVTTSPSQFQTVRNQLIGWGACMMIIYLIYLIAFPLIPAINKSKHVLDIETLLEHGRRWFGIIYILGLGILFYAYWRMVRSLHNLSKEDPAAAQSLRKLVLIIGVLCGIILLGLYPITALDVALYAARSRLWVLYGANPMTTVPASYPQDPYVTLGGEFIKMPSPYGPLFEWLARLPAQLGILDIAGGILGMKVIALLSYVGTAVLIGWHAQQESPRSGVRAVTSLGFFALNPMVILEALGNGHNDMLMLFFIMLGLILWQKDRWAWAALAFTLASLVKLTGLLILPLFGLAILIHADNWRTRLTRGFGLLAIFSITSALFYFSFGPLPEVLQGARDAAFNRQGFSPAYMLYVFVEIFLLRYVEYVLPLMKDLFAVYYLGTLILMLLKKLTFIEAGFLVFLGEIMLGTAFRIWYPLWLLPFAALNLNSRTFWRAFLFSITAEFSILSYYLLWRWVLVNWSWGKQIFGSHWEYWTIMTPLTVSWTFSIPFIGGWLQKRKDRERFENSLML